VHEGRLDAEDLMIYLKWFNEKADGDTATIKILSRISVSGISMVSVCL
jgi:hypothetical protein